MSTTEEKQRRKRRSFTPEFKAEAVRLVLEEGKTVGQVARDLDLTPTAAANTPARTTNVPWPPAAFSAA
jgi:hypothetical protein